MSEIKLLDCTLRDGAYIVEGAFGDDVITGIMKKLTAANVDIIECGWLKDAPHPAGSTYFHVPADVSPYLPEKRARPAVYTLMIDWDRYDLDSLPPRSQDTVDAIRVVFPHGKHAEALRVAERITEKGYLLFLQAANTLIYSDVDLEALARTVNKTSAVSLSIVDTFGAMYPDDLERIFSRLNACLDPRIQLGFHSHNNQQLSFALTMHFLKLGEKTDRALIVDASLCGMGRGAGNATTELVANYLNRSCSGDYDMNEILDAIDCYLTRIKENNEWGYSIPYFIAGIYCSHVNNIAYLRTHHRTLAKDMRIIIESIDPDTRRKYDYDNLERVYTDYQNRVVDDERALQKLAQTVKGRRVLVLAPGASLETERESVLEYIAGHDPFIVGVNFVPRGFACDWYFFQNAARYQYAVDTASSDLRSKTVVVTSNIRDCPQSEYVINFNLLSKRGWKYFDNAAVMCLRLLSKLGVTDIAFAGFDGFPESSERRFYANRVLQGALSSEMKARINADVRAMLRDFRACDKGRTRIRFITTSLYSDKS